MKRLLLFLVVCIAIEGLLTLVDIFVVGRDKQHLSTASGSSVSSGDSLGVGDSIADVSQVEAPTPSASEKVSLPADYAEDLETSIEDQYFMAENDIAHGVNLDIYEGMDDDFPPPDAVKWKDGNYYHASDIVTKHSHGIRPPLDRHWRELRKGAVPLRPANPYAKEMERR